MAREHVFLTPEKTIVSLPIASLGTRVLAHILDLVIFGVFLMVVLMAIGISQFSGGQMTPILYAIMPPLATLGPFLYFIVLEALWNGKTPGKAAFNLRVQMADGTPITARAALARNLLRPADLLPGTYFVGLVAMFTNPLSQRLGDLVGNTIVIINRQPTPTFSTKPHIVGYHPLEEHVGDLRGMTHEDYAALKSLTDRYYQLPAPVSSQLLRDVWQPIRSRIEIPSLHGATEIHTMEAVVMRFARIHGLL